MEIKIFYALISLLIISTGTVFAQEITYGPSINVQTDAAHYVEGDIVVVSGEVEPFVEGTDVIIQLFLGDSLVDIAQITVALDGTFSHIIIAEGPLWKNNGNYLIRASYEIGTNIIAETEFSFSPEGVETTNIFEVAVEGYGTFDVEYTIKGGNITNIIAIPEDISIIVQIESTEDGTISLDLPRELTHADTHDGKNDAFLVYIDGAFITHQETIKLDSKILTIIFEEGDSDIEIIGTYVVPEFGTIVMMILIAGIMTVILTSRNKFQIKI